MNHLSRCDPPRDKLVKKFPTALKNISPIDKSLRRLTIDGFYICAINCLKKLPLLLFYARFFNASRVFSTFLLRGYKRDRNEKKKRKKKGKKKKKKKEKKGGESFENRSVPRLVRSLVAHLPFPLLWRVGRTI